MGGRDAARKLTLKVNILQVFTIDFSEIQFIVNHNSQSDGQSRSAKNGINLQKTTIHIISLQSSRCLDEKIVCTTNQENKLKSVSIQISKDDGTHLQAHRGGTSLIEIGSELIKLFKLIKSLLCYSWFRLQSIAIHCNRRVL